MDESGDFIDKQIYPTLGPTSISLLQVEIYILNGNLQLNACIFSTVFNHLFNLGNDLLCRNFAAMIKFEKFVLDNGLRVIVHEDKSTPMAVVNVMYDVGARDEDPNKTGFAHLFEHLMFGGRLIFRIL